MKMILVMGLAAGSIFAQSTTTPSQRPPAKSTSAPAVKKKTTKPTPPLTIPAEAVDQGDGSFRYVDSKGAAWIYSKTPFGVSRALESSVTGKPAGQTPFGQSKSQSAAIAPVTPAKASDDPDAKVTAVAQGDAIEFSRPTPFGVTKWQKKKNDLTPDEQKIWERVQPKGNE